MIALTASTSSASASAVRRLLLADAVISGTTGIVMLLGTDAFQAWLALPAALIRDAGLILLPFAAMVLFFSQSAGLTSRRVWTVILMNAAWVVASVLLLVSGWIDPNAFGIGFVLVQALAVAALAEFQYAALRAQARAGTPA